MKPWRYLAMDALARRWPPVRGGRKSIAVYTPGHLGDVLHAVPMLKALRQGRPTAAIHWLVGPWGESLARRYAGAVDAIHVWGPDLPPFTRGQRIYRQSAWRQWRTAMELRHLGIGFFLGPMDGMGRFLANAACPERWSGIGDRRPPRVRPEIETFVQPYEKDRFEADALCGLLEPLGIGAHADRLEYEATPEERRAADEFLSAEQVDPSRPLAVIAPGSGWRGKNWFPERFGGIAEDLVRRRGFQVAWVGSAGEERLVPETRSADFNWMGRTSLPLLAAVIGRATLFIGNDGGLLHFAAALDVPTVSVWGPTSPGKWGPRGAIHRQVRKVERCDGCIYWDYRAACLHDHACMKAVAVEDVRRAIDELPLRSRLK